MRMIPLFLQLIKKLMAETRKRSGVGALNFKMISQPACCGQQKISVNAIILLYPCWDIAPNHSVVEHIKGNWQCGIVKGTLENKGWGADMGYYGFRQTDIEDQKQIKVLVLVSDELVANWKMLDDFEGSGYKRILAKYELANGQIGVGNIYAINDDNL